MKLSDIDLTNLDFFVHGDPHEAWRVLRAEAPLYYHARTTGQEFWSVHTYDDAMRVYHEPETYSSERGISLIMTAAGAFASPEQAGFGQMMIMVDPPRHGKIRSLINRRLTPREVAKFEPHIRRTTAEVIDAIIERGECDLVIDVAGKLPTAVICEMLGIPREYWEVMFALGNQSVGVDDHEYKQGRTAAETGLAAQAQVFAHFSKWIDERRKDPRDDLMSALIHGSIDEAKLSDLEVLFNCFLLIIGGQETTRNATTGGILALIQNPAQATLLAAHPDLITPAVEEFLRWTSPVTHIMRTATKDADLRGERIRKDDRVVVWNASANRDERVFAQPDVFDIERSPNDHLAFGHGEHFCIGANLARLELRIMIEEITRRLTDLELNGPVDKLRSNFVAGIKHMPVRFRPGRRIEPQAAAHA
jgi:cytochrome P450